MRRGFSRPERCCLCAVHTLVCHPVPRGSDRDPREWEELDGLAQREEAPSEDISREARERKAVSAAM